MRFLLFRWAINEASGGLGDLRDEGDDLIALLAADTATIPEQSLGRDARGDVCVIRNNQIDTIAVWDERHGCWCSPPLPLRRSKPVVRFDPVQWLAEQKDE